MKKFLLSLCCIGLIFSSCKKDEVSMTTFSFEKANYEITEDGAVTVKVISSAPVTENISVDFTTGGSAAEGTDYTLSADSFNFASGESEATVDVTFTAINMEDLDITLSLQAPAGYAIGETAQTRIAVPAKELVHYYFTTTNLNLITEMEVTLNLVTESAGMQGTEYHAPQEFHLPFTITTTAVAGTDYEIKDNATEFVFAEGTNSATITLVSKMTTVPDPAPVISITIDEDKIPAEYKELFAPGAPEKFEVNFGKPLSDEIIGKWAYSSFPILDDPEADQATLKMITDEGGDDLNDLPHNNTSADIIEFKVEDGVNSMVTSLTGDLANYFMDCEISDINTTTYEWYFYNPVRPLNAISATLSKVNYNFSKTSTDEKTATIYFGFSSSSEGRQLHVFVRDYQPTDFFTGTYAYGDHLVWDMYKEFGYWDLYFVFNEVTE